jgi:hypothetical protein
MYLLIIWSIYVGLRDPVVMSTVVIPTTRWAADDRRGRDRSETFSHDSNDDLPVKINCRKRFWRAEIHTSHLIWFTISFFVAFTEKCWTMRNEAQRSPAHLECIMGWIKIRDLAPSTCLLYRVQDFNCNTTLQSRLPYSSIHVNHCITKVREVNATSMQAGKDFDSKSKQLGI